MATVDGLDLFKVPVTGKMTSTNVLSACIAKELRAVCYDPGYVDANCILLNGVQQEVPKSIWYNIKHALCNPNTRFESCLENFPVFQDLFVYMANYGDRTCGTCGVSPANSCPAFHCSESHTNLFALCVKGNSTSTLWFTQFIIFGKSHIIM